MKRIDYMLENMCRAGFISDTKGRSKKSRINPVPNKW